MAAPKAEWLPEGMDANSTYLLKIRLFANAKKVRKDVICYNIEQVVDADTINYKDLVELIVDKWPCGYMEKVSVQYYDDNLKTFPHVRTDQELQEVFNKHVDSKVVRFVFSYYEPNEPPRTITECPVTPLRNQPLDSENQTSQSQPSSSTHADDDNYLANPLPENEHVGIDEEAIYLEQNELGADLMVINGSDAESVSEEDSQNGSESVSELGSDYEEDWVGKDKMTDDSQPYLAYDRDNPPMTVGSVYPNITEFKQAIAQHAIKNEFEYNIEKSDPGRFRAHCARRAEDNCKWRIHASKMDDGAAIMVKKNPSPHECSSTRRQKNMKNASKFWICEKVKDWLSQDATIKPTELQRRLKEHYKVDVHYKRVYMGKELALNQLYGNWDNSFNNLYRLKAEIERTCPGSSFIIDHHTIKGKIRFRRLFFALKPCIEGFLTGCRPYLAVDSTFLTGRFKGQLATACAVDGHNWMYPVVFGVMDSETNENWIWVMQRLKEAIGSPTGLAICTDAGQAVMTGVKEVFPTAEHRECMWHLVANFKKRWNGKVFDENLWAAAYSWHPYFFEKHWAAMEGAKPAATNYLRTWHTRLWTRSQFSTLCKVDYVTNNLAESFNNWIKQYKMMNLDDLIDKLRQLLMKKWEQRRKVARKLEGLILPHIVQKLKDSSRGLNLEVIKSSDELAEVSVLGGTGFRFVVDLHEKTCTCREWQVSGIPCIHAIAFITSFANTPLENYVDMYYSVEKFRAAYDHKIPAINCKALWPQSSHGFFMHPPLLKATAGRRRNERYKGCAEKKTSTSGRTRRHQCPVCKDFGHHWHKCKQGNPEDIAALMAERGPPKKRKTTKAATDTSVVPFEGVQPAPSMSFPSSQSVERTSKTKGKCDSTDSGVRCKSGSGSNQPEPLSIQYPAPCEQPSSVVAAATKARGTKKPSVKNKCKGKKLKPVLPSDSPAINTRSKKAADTSPAMSTRSKRRFSL